MDGKIDVFLKTDHGLLYTPDLVYCFFELVTKVTLFKEREHQKELAGLNFNTSLLISRHLALLSW